MGVVLEELALSNSFWGSQELLSPSLRVELGKATWSGPDAPVFSLMFLLTSSEISDQSCKESSLHIILSASLLHDIGIVSEIKPM